MTTNDPDWVPGGCSLPRPERPLRPAEFDDLFVTAVRRVERVTPTHTRLHLTGATGVAATVRDLTARETECCSFFQFGITPGAAAEGEGLSLDIEVPAQYADVLDALTTKAGRAQAGSPSRGSRASAKAAG